MAGQMGYHNRVDFNKLIVKIGEKGEEITPAGGFLHYGAIKGEYVLLKGSVPGPRKRAIALRKGIRANAKPPTLSIDYVSLKSQQGT
jgi:large subunit ribosomal protein L3